MQQNTLYTTQSDIFTSPGSVTLLDGYAIYAVEHPHKGSEDFTQWKEMMIDMSATTYDFYEVSKTSGGYVPESYSTATAVPSSSLVSDVKSVSPFSYFLLIPSADVSAIVADWVNANS